MHKFWKATERSVIVTKNDRPFEPKADRSDVRVRKSYYTFSKEYPHQQFELESRRNKRKDTKRVLRICLLTVCFLAIVSFAFFGTDLVLRISEKPFVESPQTPTSAVSTDLTLVKALYVPNDALSGKRQAKKAIRLLQRNDCNSVVIDFKTDDGHLAYSSAQLAAIQANFCLYETDEVREALALFQKANIQVFAGVHCFNDPMFAAAEPNAAVKFLGTDVLWLDSSDESSGKPWVNPYATAGRAYLKAVISEISALGVNGIVLKNLSFPVGDATDTASFPGEETGVKRNKLLKNLIHSIKGELPETCALLISVDANDIYGNKTKFDGSVFPNECDGVLCDTSKRASDVIIGRDDDFTGAIAYYNDLIGGTNNGAFLLEIPHNEADAKYLRALSRNGYSAFVVDQ